MTDLPPLFTETRYGTIWRMTTLAFDTHKAVKALKDAGFDDDQAEAIVTVFDSGSAELVTKNDLKAAIAEVKADLLKVAIGIVAANAGLTLAIVKLIP